MNWYLTCLKKYATFSGRARRKEYWYFTLFNIIIMFLLMAADMTTGSFNHEAGMGLLGGVYTLATFLPSLAVSVRRLHDTNRSGWWLLIVLIPLLGAIALIIFMVLDGKPGQNQYGDNPKEAMQQA
ncbi:MAG: DUF805 domain-containing protein [Magnetococcales bacterium]|nr:DUF805 domain-containing protein [Magnetococcales bacterium]